MYDTIKEEKEILEFWEKEDIFNKLREKNKGNKKWSFLDGPITANNPMGVHHAEGRTYKDLYQRFRAMQGFDQRFQNGFDCQGLWVEREEEKELGLKTKADIEKFGVLNFVQACKKRVEKFSKIIENQSKRLGFWMDWDNSYYTMTDSNNLHNWFLIKEYFKKGWLYKGKDVVPWCWRCGTASSKHDIITEGYKEVQHKAVFMKFPVKEKENEYFLIFTTTPWTVPADTAIAVNKNLTYIKAKQESNFYWIVESRAGELKGDYEVIDKVKGSELEGLEYVMPYKDLEAQKKTKHQVFTWDLASGEEGTGIVHVAPGCGPEDHELGKKNNIPAISPLDENGVFQGGFGDYNGKKYSQVNKEVLEDLQERGFIYKIEPYTHRYPHCWRCSEELVFRLVDEWYIKCTEDMRNKLIKENKKIEWSPEYGRERQEEWFKNMSDWLISRKRYWGLPLPIWECECGELEVIGSLEELKEKAVDPKKVDDLPEIHRPWVDDIKIKCKECGKEVSRVLDVGDAWLDAGITPFSTIGPYLENKKEWGDWFPADFITENMPGQYRGWFNAILWSSVALTGKASFKSILGYETVKDEKGEEMHKSKGNAIWFDDAVEKIGADSMRLLYSLQDPSSELKFGFNVIKEPKNNLNVLYNVSQLIEKGNFDIKKVFNPEDKWILSRFNSLVKDVTIELEDLNPHIATRKLRDFWLNDLSRGYIQFVRERISQGDKVAAGILSEVYLGLIKLCGPIIPFLTEKIYQDLRKKLDLKEESIFLCSWPKANRDLISPLLEEEVSITDQIIQAGLSAREKVKLGVRWPLKEVKVVSRSHAVGRTIVSMQETIKSKLNVKDVKYEKESKDAKIEIVANKSQIGKDFKQNSVKILKELNKSLLEEIYHKGSAKVAKFDLKKEHIITSESLPANLIASEFNQGNVILETELTPELETEGFVRELIRRVQDIRKEQKLKKQDRINLAIKSDLDLNSWKSMMGTKVGAQGLDFEEKPYPIKEDFKIKDKNFIISIEIN